MLSRKEPRLLPSAVRVRVRAANTYRGRERVTTSPATKGRGLAPKDCGQEGAKAKKRIRLKNEHNSRPAKRQRARERAMMHAIGWRSASWGLLGLEARLGQDKGGVRKAAVAVVAATADRVWLSTGLTAKCRAYGQSPKGRIPRSVAYRDLPLAATRGYTPEYDSHTRAPRGERQGVQRPRRVWGCPARVWAWRADRARARRTRR
jgi:hypothetical protein